MKKTTKKTKRVRKPKTKSTRGPGRPRKAVTMETKIAFRLDKDAVKMLASRRTPGLHGLSLSQVARSILMTELSGIVITSSPNQEVLSKQTFEAVAGQFGDPTVSALAVGETVSESAVVDEAQTFQQDLVE
jgi:hypothetical protein